MRASTVNAMTLIGRELTEEIDKLIQLRMEDGLIGLNTNAIEVCKRNITDSLLAMDARRGVYADDSKAHERTTKP